MGLIRNFDIIEFGSLTHPKDVSDFIKAIYLGKKAGFGEFKLDFSKTSAAFPNACVPLSGLIDYYNRNGISLSAIGQSSIIETNHLLNPIMPANRDDLNRMNALNKIFKFQNSEHVFWLVDAMLEELSQSDKFEKGV